MKTKVIVTLLIGFFVGAWAFLGDIGSKRHSGDIEQSGAVVNSIGFGFAYFIVAAVIAAILIFGISWIMGRRKD